MNFNKVQTLNFTSKLSDFEVMDSEFTKCKCYALASGDNVNGSDITMDAIDKAIARGEFYNKPIIAHLYKDEKDGSWRVGGHDSKWVITNTSFDIINECIPFGTIPESSNVRKEEVLEPDGKTINTYVVMDVILWTGRFNIMDAAYSDDVYFNQSCEISVNEYHWKDNDVFAIDDFTFSALCLLNKSDDKEKNVRPCFPSCRVEKIKSFSIDEDKFKQNFELMLVKLKCFESAGTTATVQNNAINNNKRKGESKMDFVKITEALSAQKFKNSNGEEVLKYKLLNATDSKVFALDMEDYRPYGFDYAITKNEDAEVAVIVFESKAEMSLSATDKIVDEGFNEFSIKNEIDTIKEAYSKENVEKKVQEVTASVSAAFQKEYDNLKKAYDSLVEAHKIAQGKVDAYEAKENAERIEAHKNEINSLVDSYAEKLGKYSAFLVYKANIEQKYSLTTEQVEQDLIIMAGKYMTSKENTANKKFSYNPTETGIGTKNNGVIENKYGHLLDKYIK